MQDTSIIALQVEAATIDAMFSRTPYTVVGFEADGSLVARIAGPMGEFWITL